MADVTSQPQRLVTCVIIFKDPGGPYLAEAIESVRAQTYSDWELILVDDGSKDESTAVARRFADQHGPQVRYLEHEGHGNKGMSASRNAGIRAGSGEYIAFLDADDIWVPEKLADQVERIERHPEVAYVYGPLMMWHSWTGRAEDVGKDYLQDIGVEPESVVQPSTLVTMFVRDERYVPSGVLFRRGALERVGLFEEQFRGMHEDMIVHAKICLEQPVYASGKCWYHYRQHPKGSCATELAAGRFQAAVFRFLTWVEQHMRQRGITSGPTWQAVRKEMRKHKHRWLYDLLATPGFRWISPYVKSVMGLAPALLKRRSRAQQTPAGAPGA